MRRRHTVLALSFAAATAGCGDDVEVVPADVDAIAATATCTPLAPAARVLGTSSEGELWLDDDGVTVVRDAGGATHTGAAAIADAGAALPWSADGASLLVDGELWTVRGADREFLPLPEELGRVAAWCGDPLAERGAFVGTDTGLFERLGGFWWRWSPAGEAGFGVARQLVRNDGACAGTDDVLWLVNGDGALWQIAVADARVVAGERGPITQAAAAGAAGAATLAAGGMMLGPPWHGVDFAGGPPRLLAGGGGALWVAVGADVYRRDDGGWRRVTGMPAAPVAIHAHAAGGAWFEYGDQVCHATLATPLVIRGLRPYEQRVAASADVTVVGDAPLTTVERDGVAVASLDGAGVHPLPGLALGEPGWHTLTVKAGAAARRLDYHVVDLPLRSWATDVQPIYLARCTGSACHGPMPAGTQVDLSTYQAWRTRAPRIRERLLRGQMPPVPPRLEPDTIAIVLEWIEGGMKP
jgi:hypothetical protein